MKQILLFISISFWMVHSELAFSQRADTHADDSTFIRKIYDLALSEGEAYENLRYLCKEIGARITGSTEAQMAVEWGFKKMTDYNSIRQAQTQRAGRSISSQRVCKTEKHSIVGNLSDLCITCHITLSKRQLIPGEAMVTLFGGR